MKSVLGATSHQALEKMLSHLEDDYDEIDSILEPGEVEMYRAYYKDMPYRSLLASQRQSTYRRFQRGYLRYIVSRLLEWDGPPPVVLDAGSGLGTQSILFGLLGAKVHGVDLKLERVIMAQKRAARWSEKLNVKLDVGFACESLFAVPREEKYDFIWICQAISHIDPAEDFLDLSYKLLKPGGHVVVYDPNGMYLPNQLHQLRNRGTQIHRSYTTHKGETVKYAVERLFTFGGIQRLLRRRGFSIAHAECQFHGFRGQIDDAVFERFVRRLDFLPVWTSLIGQEFVVSGRKPK